MTSGSARPSPYAVRPTAWRRRLVVIVAIGLVVGASLVVLRHLTVDPATGISGQAVVSASSVTPGSTLRGVVSAKPGPGGWVTQPAAAGAWIDFQWSRAHTVRRIVLSRGSLASPGISSGWLSFSDGSRMEVTLSKSSPTTVVPLSPRKVTGLRFTVTSVDAGARSIGLSRVHIYETAGTQPVATDSPKDGNVAPAAIISSSVSASTDDVRALTDGEAAGDNIGRSWSVSPAKGAEITLRWARPRELVMVAIAGSMSTARLTSATVYFSDGSRVAVGAVTPDSRRPTAVSFMPRATTSVRIVINTVSSPLPLTLAEVSAYEVGGSALTGASAAGPPTPVTAPGCNPTPARPTDDQGLSVECPTNGAPVAASVRLQVGAGPSYTSVRATILPGVADTARQLPTTVAVSSKGVALVDLNTSSLPAGPFTVMLEATSGRQPTKSTFFQLYRTGVPLSTAAAGPSPARGRTLVYAEEFTRPLSIARSGLDADYAASKPEVSSVQDFGDAIFADPAAGLANMQVVDNQYLQIAVKPKPAGYADPAGAQRRYVGGLLSSARPGGSGFSGQYGYFEARLLAPHGEGTWPAFWMLPSPNLVAAQTTVAEIDAVELYGRFPDSSCQSTHQFSDGKDGGVANCAQRWSSTQTAVQWHTYAVSVDPTLISYYIDNKLVATAPQVRGGDEPMFFMVDLALGGGWPIDLAPTAGHASLYVDYIHVYE